MSIFPGIFEVVGQKVGLNEAQNEAQMKPKTIVLSK